MKTRTGPRQAFHEITSVTIADRLVPSATAGDLI
jgi:hypothetical protein